MKTYRIFLPVLLALSCVFITGYSAAKEPDNSVLNGAQPVFHTQIPDSTKSKKTNLKKPSSEHKPVKARPKSSTAKDRLPEQNPTQKPLDLSIRFTAIENSPPSTEENAENQSQPTNIFASENKKKTRQVQLDGRLLMSQEPEIEKQKSADGAGIVINLKP